MATIAFRRWRRWRRWRRCGWHKKALTWKSLWCLWWWRRTVVGVVDTTDVVCSFFDRQHQLFSSSSRRFSRQWLCSLFVRQQATSCFLVGSHCTVNIVTVLPIAMLWCLDVAPSGAPHRVQKKENDRERQQTFSCRRFRCSQIGMFCCCKKVSGNWME